MRRDPLATVLRMRQETLDETQKAVAVAYQAERDACALVEEATRALDAEASAAMNLAGGDDAVENYARWLPIGRRAVERAHAEQRMATVELDRTRALLNLARAGVRAVECRIEARNAERTVRTAKREQDDADEAGRTMFLERAAENR